MSLRHDTPSEDNGVIPITPGGLRWGLQFSQTHVDLEGTWPGHSIDWEEWLGTAQMFLDRTPSIGTIGSEHPSSAARGGQERVGEDSLKSAPGGVQPPLEGKTVEHLPEGEQKMPSIPVDAKTAIGERILCALTNKNAGYMSVSRLANATDLSVEQVKAFATANPRRVRKSLIRAPNGEEVYTLNTPLSGISDSWNAFRYLNSKKF